MYTSTIWHETDHRQVLQKDVPFFSGFLVYQDDFFPQLIKQTRTVLSGCADCYYTGSGKKNVLYPFVFEQSINAAHRFLSAILKYLSCAAQWGAWYLEDVGCHGSCGIIHNGKSVLFLEKQEILEILYAVIGLKSNNSNAWYSDSSMNSSTDSSTPFGIDV